MANLIRIALTAIFMSTLITVNGKLADLTKIPWDNCQSKDGNRFCFGGKEHDQQYAVGGQCFVDKTCNTIVYAELTANPDLKDDYDIHWYIYVYWGMTYRIFFWLPTTLRGMVPFGSNSTKFLEGNQLVVTVDTFDLAPSTTIADGHFNITFYKDGQAVDTVRKGDANEAIGFRYGRAQKFDVKSRTWWAFEFISKPVISHKDSKSVEDYRLDLFKDKVFPNVVGYNTEYQTYSKKFQPKDADQLFSPGTTTSKPDEPNQQNTSTTNGGQTTKTYENKSYIIVSIAIVAGLIVVGTAIWLIVHCTKKSKRPNVIPDSEQVKSA